MANTDASSSKVESKRKREVSEKEREQAEAKRQVRGGCHFTPIVLKVTNQFIQAKRAESEAIKQQFDALDQDKAHQAEAR